MIFILLLSIFIVTYYKINADIIPYKSHVLYPAKPEYLVIPKLSKSDAPNWKPGRGKSYIDLSALTLKIDCSLPNTNDDCENSKFEFELLMFQAPEDFPWFSYWPDNVFCCNTEELDNGDCSDEDAGSLIIPKTLPSPFFRTVKLNAENIKYLSSEGSLIHHDISESGEYIFFMSICDENAAPIVINGHIESIDPYGYLPANLFGSLPFYGALSIVYSVIGIVWMIYCSLYSDQLISLQFWISAVLALGMIETMIMFAHYLHWNDVGLPSNSLLILALSFGVAKRAMSRIVVQLVALGYGVVRPSIGDDFNRVLALGGGYMVFSLFYTLFSNLPNSNKSVDKNLFDLLSLTIMLLAGIDTTFYVWIFSSIQNLLASLASRKQGMKYLLYRNFRAVLFVSLFFTCIWVLYGSTFVYDTNFGTNANWKYRWTVDALWELTYFAIFLALAFLWAPSRNSQRYAYAVELTQLEDDEEYNAELSKMIDGNDSSLDNEYGGRLNDDNDPFGGSGALDTTAATVKKA